MLLQDMEGAVSPDVKVVVRAIEVSRRAVIEPEVYKPLATRDIAIAGLEVVVLGSVKKCQGGIKPPGDGYAPGSRRISRVPLPNVMGLVASALQPGRNDGHVGVYPSEWRFRDLVAFIHMHWQTPTQER
mmetsp:Transcript_19044/g.51773  ORF Transcript_19044/g.51773 Transcript_19044/m.51773 type:complete len:129 (+) Transcript_19044:1130-1516(+)